MQLFDSQCDLSSVEASSTFRESHILSQMEEEFSAIQEINHKIQLLVSLKSIMQMNNKRRIHRG